MDNILDYFFNSFLDKKEDDLTNKIFRNKTKNKNKNKNKNKTKINKNKKYKR
jgi:hypothetical protein